MDTNLTSTSEPSPSGFDQGEQGSALAATPGLPQEPEGAEKPGEAQKAPKKATPLEERIAKAEGALLRHKETSKRLYQELESYKAKYTPMEQEYAQLKSELERFRELKERLAEGDEDALRELGGDFDLLIDRRLDPHAKYAKPIRRELSETERKLRELELWREQQIQREQQREYQREVETFLQVASSAEEYPDLQVLGREELVQMGQHVAPDLARYLGRAPTFAEIARVIQEQVAAYHEKVYQMYQKKKTPPSPSRPPAPPPPPPGISNRVVTEAATTDRVLSPEERKARALEIAKQRLSQG